MAFRNCFSNLFKNLLTLKTWSSFFIAFAMYCFIQFFIQNNYIGLPVAILGFIVHAWWLCNQEPKTVKEDIDIINDFKCLETFIRFYPILITFIFATNSDRIKTNSLEFFAFNLKLSNFTLIDWPLLIFWILLFIYMFYLPQYYEGVSKTNKESLEKILNSVHEAPDRQVFAAYSELYNKTMDELYDNNKTDKTSFESNLEEIKAILKSITELVKYFSPYDDSIEKIGANVWLVLRLDDNKIKPGSLIPSFRTSINPNDGVIGIAVLVNDLILKESNSGHINFNFEKPLVLPIHSNDRDENGFRIALPGVPFAAIEGASAHYNVSLIENDLRDFSAPVREEVLNYFNKGDGKPISSFASFRLGNGQNPVGVLNLDSKNTHIVGNKRFLKSLLSLLTPFMYELRIRVEKYVDFLDDQSITNL